MKYRCGDILWLAPGARPNLESEWAMVFSTPGPTKVTIEREDDIDPVNGDYFVTGVDGFKLYGWVGEDFLSPVTTS